QAISNRQHKGGVMPPLIFYGPAAAKAFHAAPSSPRASAASIAARRRLPSSPRRERIASASAGVRWPFSARSAALIRNAPPSISAITVADVTSMSFPPSQPSRARQAAAPTDRRGGGARQ